MKNIIKYTLGVVVILLAVYYIVPNDTGIGKIKARALDFLNGKTIEIRNSFEEILPKSDSQKSREEIINELKENLKEIKNRTSENDGEIKENKNETANSKVSTTQEIIQATEKIINQLEEENNNQSATKRVLDKIMDTILPVKETEIEC